MQLKVLVLGLLLAAALRADDGPYVFWKGDQARVLTIHDGLAEEKVLPPPYRLELEGLPPLDLDPRMPAAPPAIYPAPARIAAVSDIHGHLDHLAALLQAQGIVDRQRRWAFGDGHLVVVGDAFDKGAKVTQLFWFLRSLEVQARAAGGHFHMVLGNHEVMELRGNTRSLNAKYRALDRIPMELYGPDSDMGRWLRTRPVLLQLGDTLFVHGGPAPALLKAEVPLEACNERFRKAIDEPDKDVLLQKLGPIFYRGILPVGASAFQDATDAEVDAILAAFQVKRMVVGHTTLGKVMAFHKGQVFGIDADLQSGKPGELWLSLDGQRFRGLADGRRKPLP